MLDQAVAAGAVNAEQAVVIADAVKAMPDRVRADLGADAEATLIDQAAQLDPAYLRKVGERILSYIAPEVAEAAEAKALADMERRAHAARGFTISPVRDGRCRVSGHLTAEDAAIVTAALDPLCKPNAEDTRIPAQRRADALVEVCQLAHRAGDPPGSGGTRPIIVVMVRYEDLHTAHAIATLDTGQQLTAGQLRRWACDAHILPTVLDGASVTLDAGRTSRYTTTPIRRAAIIRDRGCAFPGCDRPPKWCDMHHIVSWIDDGPTCLDNLVLLCRFHHQLIHNTGWEVRLGPDRLPEFRPPSFVDPDRTPRRNILHRRN